VLITEKKYMSAGRLFRGPQEDYSPKGDISSYVEKNDKITEHVRSVVAENL
jgi:hypothetical protein